LKDLFDDELRGREFPRTKEIANLVFREILNIDLLERDTRRGSWRLLAWDRRR
jgi:hypothetical protein